MVDVKYTGLKQYFHSTKHKRELKLEFWYHTKNQGSQYKETLQKNKITIFVMLFHKENIDLSQRFFE